MHFEVREVMVWSTFSLTLNLTFKVGHYLCWELSCSVEVFSSVPQTLPDVPRGKEPPLVGTTGTEIENWEHSERLQSAPISFCNDNFEDLAKFFKPPVCIGNGVHTSASSQNGLL